MNLLKINQKITVVHRSSVDPKSGLANIVPAKPHTTIITKVYDGGDTVQVKSGDVWKVRLSFAYPESDWVTVK